MQTVTTIGLDVAKSVFQLHGTDAAGSVVDDCMDAEAICEAAARPSVKVGEGEQHVLRSRSTRRSAAQPERTASVSDRLPRTALHSALRRLFNDICHSIRQGRRTCLCKSPA